MCQKKCKKSNYKDLIGKNIHITKFKFKCINGCGEEIPFSDIQKHYNKKCKNIKKKKLMSSKKIYVINFIGNFSTKFI